MYHGVVAHSNQVHVQRKKSRWLLTFLIRPTHRYISASLFHFITWTYGVEVCVPAGLPDPTRTDGFGSGRVISPRVRVGSGRGVRVYPFYP